MAILQVYQAKVLKDLHEGDPDPELLQELRSVTDYALRATKAGLFGETVEEFAQQYSKVKKQTEAIKHILPLREQLRPRNLPVLQLDPFNGSVLIGRWHRQLILRPQRTLVRLQSISETGSPGKEDCLTCRDPHSARGQVLDSAPTRLSATWQMATTWSIKEQSPSSLGVTHSTSDPLHDGRTPCSLVRTCGHTPHVFPHVLKQQVHSDDSSLQGSSAQLSRHEPVGQSSQWSPGLLTSGHTLFPQPQCPHPRAQDWFVAIDLKDAYFHVSILLDPFLRFAFEGRAYQHKVLPFGLSLSPRIFTKVAEAALGPLREVGIRILNYLDDWLILAHSWDLVCAHRDVVRNHLAQLGLRINWEKSKLSPVQRARTVSVEVCSNTQMRVYGPPETSSEAPGAHGIFSRGHAAGFGAHETSTTLASYLSPAMGMALRHVSCEHHTIMSQGTLDRHCVPAVRFSLGGERRLHLQSVQLIWDRFSQAQVDLFAPSTRRLCDLKRRIFVNWCSSQGKDPRRCGIESVLSFLQGGLDRHLSASTLKDHVAAKSANHDLSGLQALSVNSSCLELGPADSHAVLRPRPGYVPKVPTTPFGDQVVTLQAISSQEDDPNLTLLCPVHALRIYMERTQPFRCSEQLFVCYGGQQKGKAVSKQRISHWLVDAICTAYQARGLPCPLGVRAHSTRGVAASAALVNGASLTDICKAAGWATPNTFARFYNLRMEPVLAGVLNASS
ncbi:hypothetical protein M9458_051976 [Cirrhinus mrigala]|uniref:ribonuclease H n=1 Tax=Cirrhinus mrigala TaxID=683832 RepID=A0ABD0MVY3_CIRMR